MNNFRCYRETLNQLSNVLRYMRPNDSHEDKKLYECYGCGNRKESPEKTVCELCGSDLRRISRPRDL